MLQKSSVSQISISMLEQSINYWRNTYPSDKATMQLCEQASKLADLYGYCIINNIEIIDGNDLSLEQLNLLRFA